MVTSEATLDKPLAARLAIALHSKIEILRNDRPLMGALLRYAGDPKHPHSFFGATLR